MKNFILKSITIIILLNCFTSTFAQQQCPIIPQPLQSAKQTGTFSFSQQTVFVVDAPAFSTAARYLQQQLLEQYHFPVSIQTSTSKSVVRWQLSKNKKLETEAYTISMNDNEIIISATDERGAFYAAISLLQLMSNAKKQNDVTRVDCWNITDAPLYGWRGLMLDESRHFFGKEKVKSILDWMAFYKLNRFHWHLTDTPGWRFEIKKYPLLTLVGGIGNHSFPYAAAAYYTQEDTREIVRYAAERQIIIIPEVDMPGHATAANKAYPQYSGGGSARYPEFTFNPGKEETYSYLTDILRETNALFPSAMLHLGGDEVSFGNEKWTTDPSIKQLMQQQKLTSTNAVEQYFMNRIADSVFAMQAKLLAWDEVAEADLPVDKTIMFWWRHDKPAQLQKALNKNYSVVLCPRIPLYFDFVQDSSHTRGRKWDKAFSPLEDVYKFNANSLTNFIGNHQKNILGIQANVWTETIATPQQLDFMLFPRIAALAEAAWTNESNKNYDNFSSILQQHLQLYKEDGIEFYNPFVKKQN